MTAQAKKVRGARTPLEWLNTFGECVRARNFDAGRALFDPEVTAFGTVACEVHGLDELVREQWSHVWGVTEAFDFLDDTIRVETIGECAWVTAQWKSFGRRGNGESFLRHGRVTYILRLGDQRWTCVHSHHSFVPKA